MRKKKKANKCISNFNDLIKEAHIKLMMRGIHERAHAVPRSASGARLRGRNRVSSQACTF